MSEGTLGRAFPAFMQKLPQGDQLPMRDWMRRHAGIQILLAIQIVGLLAFGLYQGTGPLHIGWEIAGLTLLLLLSSWNRLGRRLQSVLSSAALITCSALLTHLSGGYIEAHFHFFVMLGVIVLYEDWLPFSLSILYVAVHHGTVGTLDPQSVYNHPAAFADPWLWAGIRAVFILWLSAALILYWRISESLRAKTDLVMRSTPTGMVGVDPHGRVSFANPAAAKLLNAKVDELIGRNHHDFIVPASTNGRVGAEPSKVRTSAGEFVPVELSTNSVQPHLVNVERVITITDIRERLEAERELQSSEERFRALSACSPVGIFVTDVNGQANYTNPRLQEICGFTPAEGLGHGWARFVHPDDQAGIVKGWSDYVAQANSGIAPNSFHMELRFNNPTLGLRWVSVRAAPLANDNGVVLGHVGTVEDITQRQEAAERLKEFNQRLEVRVSERTRDLELAMKELESFNYSVSHDLRSPLRVITGFSELLLDSNSANRLDDGDLDSLREIRDASQRMNRTVDALLHLSTINRTRINRQQIDLSALALAVSRSLRREQPDRAVTIDIQEGLSADADPELLAVVLQNLLGNAWKFTREQPNPRIEFGAFQAPTGTVYFVRDNGVGFDSADAPKLFRPFYRLHEAERFEGSGIGLATVARIVERHGGQARAAAAPEQGTVILFTLDSATVPAIAHPREIDGFRPRPMAAT